MDRLFTFSSLPPSGKILRKNKTFHDSRLRDLINLVAKLGSRDFDPSSPVFDVDYVELCWGFGALEQDVKLADGCLHHHISSNCRKIAGLHFGPEDVKRFYPEYGIPYISCYVDQVERFLHE